MIEADTTAATRPPSAPGLDATAILTVYLVLLVAVPAGLIFKPLGASGTPANILGIGCLVWWAATRLQGGRGRQSNPVRIALLLFGLAVLPSLAAMYLRGAPGIETSAANRAVLIFLGGAGVTLLIVDGIDTLARLERFLKRFVVAAAVLSCTGLLQAVTRIELATRLRIPGLQYNPEIEPIGARGHFTRVQGTTSHPIEFGVVLAIAFPIALHYAMTAPRGRRSGPVLCTVLIALGIPLSLSRSGLIGLIVAFVVVMGGWTWRQRVNGLAAAVMFAGVTRAVIPGLLGTVLHLFTQASSDSSTQARTSRYDTLGHYFLQTPWVGRGFGTFLPQNYLFVDNQYYLTAIEMGAVGLVALIVMFMIGVFTARGARRHAADPQTAGLAQALVGAILACAVSFATYDALSFPVATAFAFVLLGAIGALWRLTRAGAEVTLPSLLPVRLAPPAALVEVR
jgi:hypothetical protein